MPVGFFSFRNHDDYFFTHFLIFFCIFSYQPTITMADIQESSSSPSQPQTQPDDISLFLHQILLRSSSPNLSISPFPDIIPPYRPLPLPESTSGWNSISAGYFPPTESSSVGNTDNDPDEYDCDESEEGFELHPRIAPPRNSSKRSRAAEVHNLSEKRRRSKINEKMKALQKLIPNSNKTDKASMLDEAIEYLKQLQLQVQMLTMRNGSSLYPSSGLLQHNQLSHIKMSTFCEVNNDPLTNILPAVLHQSNDLLTMPNQQLTLEGDDHNNQLGIQNHLALAQSEQVNMIPDFQSLFPLNAKGGSNFKDDGLEACILRRSDDDEMPFLPHLSGCKRGRRDPPKI